jgi:Cu(I)/Ag(I) efflux system membrane fusion protein
VNLFKNFALLLSGALLMLAALSIWRPDLFRHVTDMQATSATNDSDKPLYWVAPMDPNYRRDAAGKSPMGMDLVPVFAKGKNGDEDSPGTIEISPEVVNSLGVRTGKVVLDHLQPEIRTVGYLQYNQDSIVHIHPRVEGWVENSFVNTVGAPVEQGQRLYTLYSPALVNAQEELLFGLKRDDQRLIQAAEQRLLALQISDAVIRQLKRDRQVSQTVTFYAPASGVVEELNIREGLYVKPGMTLMSIANLDEIWIEAEVFERQASLVKVGLPVEVDLDFLPGDVRQGKVDYIYPSLNAQTRTLRVRVRLDNSDSALKPNMFAELRILASDQNERLLIPKEALIRGGQQNRVVLALGEGRFKSLAVKTGQSDNQRVEILDGLIEGEKIVTSAQFLLDSESSKSSDFTRIDATDGQQLEKPAVSQDAQKATAEIPGKVWVEAIVNSVDINAMKLNAQHGPIPEWSWPLMQMDFKLTEWMNAGDIPTGQSLQLEITRTESGKYEVTDFYLPAAEQE